MLPARPRLLKTVLLVALTLVIAHCSSAQDEGQPAELQVIKDSVGVWDAAIEVWPRGKDQDSVQFQGVETTRAYGEYWLSSDFVSEYQGHVQKVHSIVGYDLNEKKLIGKVIDHGPYLATMTGEYDQKTKTVHWITKVKSPSGQPLEQRTSVTHKSADERVLVLKARNPKTGKFAEFMRIKYTRRK